MENLDNTTHDYLCPACKQPLCYEYQSMNVWAMWCGNGPCKSEAMNQGVASFGLQACYADLIDKFEDEMEKEV